MTGEKRKHFCERLIPKILTKTFTLFEQFNASYEDMDINTPFYFI